MSFSSPWLGMLLTLSVWLLVFFSLELFLIDRWVLKYRLWFDVWNKVDPQCCGFTFPLSPHPLPFQELCTQTILKSGHVESLDLLRKFYIGGMNATGRTSAYGGHCGRESCIWEEMTLTISMIPSILGVCHILVVSRLSVGDHFYWHFYLLVKGL